MKLPLPIARVCALAHSSLVTRHSPLVTSLSSLALALALAAFMASGCALFREKPLTEVNDSQLNWLNVRYHPASKDKKPCCLNIVGVGSVEFKQGRSPLVFNSFSQDVGNPLWGDIEEEKLGVTPEQARWIMQLFVDAGLMDEASRMKKLARSDLGKAESGIAIIAAKLNGKQVRVATNSQPLIDTVESLVEAIVSNRGFH